MKFILFGQITMTLKFARALCAREFYTSNIA